MNEPLVSIDFGNSFTKVGVRRSVDDESITVSDGSLGQFDQDLEVCIPTLAAYGARRGKERWWFGGDVAGLDGADGVQVYRNWKPAFFDGLETHLSAAGDVTTVPPLDDRAWKEAQAQFGLPDSQRESFESMRRRSAGGGPTPREIAVGFFRWLKAFVEPICAAEEIDLSGGHRTRITLPAFGAQTRAAGQLQEILTEAGWQMDTIQACLPEPVANAMGIFAEGRNSTWKPNGGRVVRPHFGNMFGGSMLFTAARRRALNKYSRRMHWVFIADLGGYTLDFAMAGFDLTDMSVPQGRYNRQRRLASYSEPLGVTDLDQRVQQALDSAGQEVFREITSSIDQRRLEALHSAVYQQRVYRQGGYRLGVGKASIGEDPAEADRITAAIEGFAAQAAEVAGRFIEVEQYERIDDLILTGGGMNIPEVRDALRDKLSQIGSFKHAYVPALSDEGLGGHYSRLEPLLVRASTALGGSSVYFDFKPVAEVS